MDNLIPELYRAEYGKMVAVLCSRFGIGFMDEAADIVSETFLTAAETWGMKGMPANPAAWLYTVAKNNALNSLRHNRVFDRKVRGHLLREPSSTDGAPGDDIRLTQQQITDSQLRMVFTVCHPSIPAEAQVCLALRVLCGFTIDEIASAYLTTRENINKRLFRAKQRLRAEKIKMDFPPVAELPSRLDAVLVTLYLLFNEGYYSASPDKVLRKDFCLEAMRLVYLLTTAPAASGISKVQALMALMCFQASRFDARTGTGGELILYEDQDNTLWDRELINRGNQFFVQASNAGELSRYHLEAAIAWWHTNQADATEKWENILRLYNHLLVLEYTPVAALNRSYAYARVYGKEMAIREAEALRLEGNLFYHSLLGDLYTGIDDRQAFNHLQQAMQLAGSAPEQAVLRAKLERLSP
ncbi:MAG TPA: sigma-70 family RNA polymerase sigma factor [Puia sp.]|nr:sigma-70 family RNA polymerase sigma factor [Puia sp.]